MGEGPVLHISGSHHPALSEDASQYKAAQSMLLTYLPYTSTVEFNNQAFFQKKYHLQWKNACTN